MTAECGVTESPRNRFRLATTVYDGEDPVLDGEAAVLVEALPSGTAERPAATDA